MNEGEVWCRWDKCNDIVEIHTSFWHGCFSFVSYLRNPVSCPPALLEMLLLLSVALVGSQAFSWLWRRAEQPKYGVIFMDQSHLLQVFF